MTFYDYTVQFLPIIYKYFPYDKISMITYQLLGISVDCVDAWESRVPLFLLGYAQVVHLVLSSIPITQARWSSTLGAAWPTQ